MLMALPPPELERTWLEQLAWEHARICHERRLHLVPPLIRLSRGMRRLGAWSGEKREISLSSAFVARHPWAVVLQIFRHEMAHQLCEEAWHCAGAGHGPEFRRACTILGVESHFQGAGVDLDDAGLRLALQSRENPGPQERLHARIRKLLALADSDNEHEAALALTRARALLTRHRTEAAGGVEAPEHFVHESIVTTQQRMPACRSAICSLLLQYFAVRVVIASTYDQHRNRRVRTVELLGRAQDVAVAKHCYHFLEERLATLWQAQRHRFGAGNRRARTSYRLGLVAGFCQTLAKSGDASGTPPNPSSGADSGAERALVPGSARLDRFVEERFPRLRTQRRPGRWVARDAYSAALEEGRRLRMPSALADTGPGVGMLPAPAAPDGNPDRG